MGTNFYITYISPNNSTRVVAHVLAEKLKQAGREVSLLDLSENSGRRAFMDKLTTDPCPCLLVGSPVYRDMAVPPVMAFIDGLPEMQNAWAAPFVTWGTACSGVALWQMGRELAKKRFKIAGAAKVGALHSLMWHSDPPAGLGRPNEEDEKILQVLADRLMGRLDTGSLHPLPLENLDYQTEERAKEYKAKLENPWMIIPKTVDNETCTECGVCADECPAAAIALAPLPEFGSSCFDCFNCVRLCPENAIEPKIPLKNIEAMIRERVRTIKELPLTQVYLHTDG